MESKQSADIFKTSVGDVDPLGLLHSVFKDIESMRQTKKITNTVGLLNQLKNWIIEMVSNNQKLKEENVSLHESNASLKHENEELRLKAVEVNEKLQELEAYKAVEQLRQDKIRETTVLLQDLQRLNRDKEYSKQQASLTREKINAIRKKKV